MFDPAVGDVAGIPYVLILFGIALSGVIGGAIWWRRITHNHEDEPKSWRYHDHD